MVQGHASTPHVWKSSVVNELPKRAGEGNRTLIASLEGWSFTIKLHPRESYSRSGLVDCQVGDLDVPGVLVEIP